MSPNDRDRAREKRRYEKRQSAVQQREDGRRRNNQAIGVVVAVLLVVGALVGLSLALGKDDGVKAASGVTPSVSANPRGSANGPATPSQTASGSQVPGCSAAPKAPGERKSTLPDKALAAGKTFIATVTTSCGVITMELDGAKAPQTVASFLGLAKGGYWADSPCHRLTGAQDGIFVLQCGDPTGLGSGGPGYGFGVENPPADSQYPPGTLAMARAQDPNSNAGQFFIVYKQTQLPDPAGYSIFGKVTGGMGIVDKIAAAGISQSNPPAPAQPISILSVAVTEKKA